eukprot:TRINITY_DN185_c0_g1_i10.p1 TRINITY_DN185_c0_g1~~TRINITY_DN185_c0_g1_i10.p1  ORF type:complete len:173 (-),score=51.18 TRINITY_DN185_c0_g1_i10:151-669(-)
MRTLQVDAVPVDYVADCIAHIAMTSKSTTGQDINVCGSSITIATLVDAMLSYGYPVKYSAYDEWEGQVTKTVLSPTPTAVSPLLPLTRTFQSTQSAKLTTSCTSVPRLCADVKLAPHVVDIKVLTNMIAFLVSKGYMKSPPRNTRKLSLRCWWLAVLVLVVAVMLGIFSLVW